MLVDGRLTRRRSRDVAKASGKSTRMICCRYVCLLWAPRGKTECAIHKSFTLGRPPSFTLVHIDCKKPYTEDPNNEETCQHFHFDQLLDMLIHRTQSTGGSIGLLPNA